MANSDFYVAIVGCGVVGSGVADILLERSEDLSRRFARKVALKRILDIRDFTGTRYEPYATKNPEDILDDPEITAVVVTVGGLDFAYNISKKALLAGKHVITSNKEVVAEHGRELTTIAFEKGIRFCFEASSGGGVPIIRPLNICMRANEYTDIKGIVNGTTNFILSRMETDNLSFEDALELAKQRGYAEADPSADVDGFDAARKISVLSMVAFDRFVDYKAIPCRGIRDVTHDDIELAAELCHGRVRLIASCVDTGKGLRLSVEPMLVMPTSPLYSVTAVRNGILVGGKYTGHMYFSGRGAGKLPTGSAVCGDIIDLLGGNDKMASLPEYVTREAVYDNTDDTPARYYIRLGNFKFGEKPIGSVEGLTEAAGEDLSFADTENSYAILTGVLMPDELEEFVSAFCAFYGYEKPDMCLKVIA